jgi:hypothetical protein
MPQNAANARSTATIVSWCSSPMIGVRSTTMRSSGVARSSLVTGKTSRTSSNATVSPGPRASHPSFLRLTGPFACPHARPATASQAREPDSPLGFRPKTLFTCCRFPVSNSTLGVYQRGESSAVFGSDGMFSASNASETGAVSTGL